MPRYLGIPHSWAEKIVDLYIKTAGINNDSLHSNCISRLHYSMLLPILTCICQEFVGIVIKVKQDHYTIGEVVIHFQYITLMCTKLTYMYFLANTRPKIAKCVQHAVLKLHCSSYVNQKLIWQKHMPIFKALILVIVGPLYVAGIGVTVLSPVIRYGFQVRETYVVFPNWYPVDVTSYSLWFCVALVHESALMLYSVHVVVNTCVLFLYVVMVTKVRLEALSVFFEDIAASNAHDLCRLEEMEEGSFTKINELTHQITDCAKNKSKKRAHGDTLIADKFRRGIEDWKTLRRQTKLISETFAIYVATVHLAVSITNVIMLFAVANELRNAREEGMAHAVAESLLYLNCIFGIAPQAFCISYNITSLQNSYDHLRTALWNCNWYTWETGFQKLYFHFKASLNRTLTVKVYSFYPVDLQSFYEDVSRAFSYFMFLYQISAMK